MNLEPWPSVTVGSSNPRVVTAVQYPLRHHGHTVTTDGLFGAGTKAAVQAFQAAEGLGADGTVGPLTWRKLVVTLKQGDSGDGVRALQALGLVYIPGDDPLTVDGHFGPLTDGRVGLVQDLYGLLVDGIVGAQTWSFVAASNPWPLVRVGHSQHTNHRVTPVQHLLRARGTSIVADGYYGPATGAAMKAFQQTIRSDDLGTTCGQRDWPALVRTVAAGTTGDVVQAVQHLLSEVTPDGSFGPQTVQAITNFQEMWGLEPDGVVGPLTWAALVKPHFD